MPIRPIIKVFVAGEGGVGKTTMIDRYVKGIFNPNTIMTIGVNHAVKDVTVSTKTSYTLQIWDLGGEDRFRFIVPMYVKGSQAGMLVFDTTRFSTFRHLDAWLELIRQNVPNIPLLLVGTKIDLQGANLDEKEYQRVVKDHGLVGLVLTSAKDGTNIEKAFMLLSEIYDQQKKK
jgi:small GTP-binding protein